MAKAIVLVVVTLACLGASAVILAPKLAGHAEADRREQADARRLADSLRFIDTLAIDPEHRATLRAIAPGLHDEAFESAYDTSADPALDEPLYMRHFTYALYNHASSEGERELARQLQEVFRNQPGPGAGPD